MNGFRTNVYWIPSPSLPSTRAYKDGLFMPTGTSSSFFVDVVRSSNNENLLPIISIISMIDRACYDQEQPRMDT